jgi:guanylate kinase
MNDDLDEAVKDFLTVVDSVRSEDGRAYAFSTKNDEIVKMIEGVLINA